MSLKGQSPVQLKDNNQVIYRIYSTDSHIIPHKSLCLLWNQIAERYISNSLCACQSHKHIHIFVICCYVDVKWKRVFHRGCECTHCICWYFFKKVVPFSGLIQFSEFQEHMEVLTGWNKFIGAYNAFSLMCSRSWTSAFYMATI